MRRSVLILAALSALVPAAALAAPPEGKGPPPHAAAAGKAQGAGAERHSEKGTGPGNDALVAPLKKGDASVGDVILSTVLTEAERRLIRDYFTTTPASALPPGLAKRDRLPPGLAAQVERNGVLPPGLSGQALPDDLTRRLPRRAAEIDRVVVGSDVLLIERGTRLILDILEDVIAS